MVELMETLYKDIIVSYPIGMDMKHVEIYCEEVIMKHEDKNITHLEIVEDGDYVDVKWSTAAQNFDRIRRITGYLVGTLDRFNDGKRSEERDRVHHS